MNVRSNVAAVMVFALALGAGFGAVIIFIGRVVFPAEPSGLDSQLVDMGWGWVVGVASVVNIIVNQVWAWVALAVAAGWLARTVLRGAVAGALALLAATVVFWGMYGALGSGQSSWDWALYTMLLLGSLNVFLGPVLGAVGAYIGRPGVPGLLAGLAVPVGATVQMIWLPHLSAETTMDPAMSWTRVIVWVAAAAAAGVVITRFCTAKLCHR